MTLMALLALFAAEPAPVERSPYPTAWVSVEMRGGDRPTSTQTSFFRITARRTPDGLDTAFEPYWVVSESKSEILPPDADPKTRKKPVFRWADGRTCPGFLPALDRLGMVEAPAPVRPSTIRKAGPTPPSSPHAGTTVLRRLTVDAMEVELSTMEPDSVVSQAWRPMRKVLAPCMVDGPAPDLFSHRAP